LQHFASIATAANCHHSDSNDSDVDSSEKQQWWKDCSSVC